MSGFETRWLDLREPADHAARHSGLRRLAIDHLDAAGEEAGVVDLGCGTGSTFRALLPRAAAWRWLLVDNDPLLLAEAKARHAAGNSMEFAELDLTAIPSRIFGSARLVTASALFDLVSEDMIQMLADQVGAADAGLYAALNYDGNCTWGTPHAMDDLVVEAFNRHQRGDKGFGPAHGPESGPALKRIFESAGLHVSMQPSPWRLGTDEAELQRQFIAGMADAVAETQSIEADVLEDWRRYRLAHAATSTCNVGHWDVLALR